MKLNFGYGGLLLNISDKSEDSHWCCLTANPSMWSWYADIADRKPAICYIHSLYENNMSKNPEHLSKDL